MESHALSLEMYGRLHRAKNQRSRTVAAKDDPTDAALLVGREFGRVLD